MILGIFVTLSHTSGIVLVGVLASLGSTWWRPQRIEAYLAVAVGVLVIVLGLWMLWVQRDLVALAMGEAGEPGDGTTITTMLTITCMAMSTANLWSGIATEVGKVHAPPIGRRRRKSSETACAAGAGYCGRPAP